MHHLGVARKGFESILEDFQQFGPRPSWYKAWLEAYEQRQPVASSSYTLASCGVDIAGGLESWQCEALFAAVAAPAETDHEGAQDSDGLRKPTALDTVLMRHMRNRIGWDTECQENFLRKQGRIFHDCKRMFLDRSESDDDRAWCHELCHKLHLILKASESILKQMLRSRARLSLKEKVGLARLPLYVYLEDTVHGCEFV